MTRYYLTAEAAHRLGVPDTATAWRILRAAKVQPVGTMPRDDGEPGAPVLVWPAAEVEQLRARRGRMSATQRRIQANIRRSILVRREKRNAVS